MTITKHGRFFALRDERGELIAVTVYKKGALEIIRRLEAAQGEVPPTNNSQSRNEEVLANRRNAEAGMVRNKA